MNYRHILTQTVTKTFTRRERTRGKKVETTQRHSEKILDQAQLASHGRKQIGGEWQRERTFERDGKWMTGMVPGRKHTRNVVQPRASTTRRCLSLNLLAVGTSSQTHRGKRIQSRKRTSASNQPGQRERAQAHPHRASRPVSPRARPYPKDSASSRSHAPRLCISQELPSV